MRLSRDRVPGVAERAAAAAKLWAAVAWAEASQELREIPELAAQPLPTSPAEWAKARLLAELQPAAAVAADV